MTDNEKAEFIQPLRDIVNGDAFKSVLENITNVQVTFSGERSLFPHLNGIVTTMTGLQIELANWPVHADEPEPTPLPSPEPE